jgi:tight adherence protein C
VWSMLSSIALIPEMPPLVQQVLLVAVPVTAILGALWPGVWLARLQRSRQRDILRALPFILDLLTLSVESGASLALALAHAADKGPASPLRDELRRMLDEVKTGRARGDALRAMADRIDLPAVSNWVAAMISAQQQGSSLGPLMRAQAEQRRQERFLHAEKVAMKAPVKMLFPLLVFIFPCTFLLLFFPVVVRLLQEGVLR